MRFFNLWCLFLAFIESRSIIPAFSVCCDAGKALLYPPHLYVRIPIHRLLTYPPCISHGSVAGLQLAALWVFASAKTTVHRRFTRAQAYDKAKQEKNKIST